MCSGAGRRWFATAGFPIRTSPDQRLYTAARGFSQCPTSFFGAWRPGIHHKPFVASLHVMRRIRSSSYSFLLVLLLYVLLLHSIGLVRFKQARFWACLLPAVERRQVSSISAIEGTCRPSTWFKTDSGPAYRRAVFKPNDNAEKSCLEFETAVLANQTFFFSSLFSPRWR